MYGTHKTPRCSTTAHLLLYLSLDGRVDGTHMLQRNLHRSRCDKHSTQLTSTGDLSAEQADQAIAILSALEAWPASCRWKGPQNPGVGAPTYSEFRYSTTTHSFLAPLRRKVVDDQP